MSGRDELLDLIDAARFYVNEFYPRTADEQRDQEALLARIDAVLPTPPPPESFEICDDPECNLSKGHMGPHCDIPF